MSGCSLCGINYNGTHACKPKDIASKNNKEYISFLEEKIHLIAKDRDQFRAKVAELQKDADRYKWLREQNADLTNDAFLVLSHDQECGYCNGAWVGSDLDGAIDEVIDKAKDTV
jgi:hypothetical protein